jgi:hypothetical protein
MLTSYSLVLLLHFILVLLTSCLSFCRFDLIHGSLHGWSASFPFVLLFCINELAWLELVIWMDG